MKTQEVQFGGNNYPCRVVESNEGEELLIGSITLLDALQPGSFNDENEGFASKEAERIYDEVVLFQFGNQFYVCQSQVCHVGKEENLVIDS